MSLTSSLLSSRFISHSVIQLLICYDNVCAVKGTRGEEGPKGIQGPRVSELVPFIFYYRLFIIYKCFSNFLLKSSSCHSPGRDGHAWTTGIQRRSCKIILIICPYKTFIQSFVYTFFWSTYAFDFIVVNVLMFENVRMLQPRRSDALIGQQFEFLHVSIGL